MTSERRRVEPPASRSHLGRPLVAHAFGPVDEPTLALVFGAIHGDEPHSAVVVQRLADALDAEPPEARVIVAPVVNPDGLAAGHKDNARGVDLNRNFPARNWTVAHRDGCFPGDAPLSEPETAWLAALVDETRPERIVAVHQPFACVNYDGPAVALAARMSAACGWPVVADLGYPTPGSFGSRYGIDGGIAVITLELPRQPSPAELAGALAALRLACEPAPR